jgi:hypothetical protein
MPDADATRVNLPDKVDPQKHFLYYTPEKQRMQQKMKQESISPWNKNSCSWCRIEVATVISRYLGISKSAQK